VHALGVVAEQQRREAQRLAAPDLTVVGDVRLQAERRHLVGAPVRLVQSHPGQERVGGEVEDHDVVAHVHVAVVVDPLGTDDVAVFVEGRGQVGHGGQRRSSAQEIRMRLLAIHA
jgi:hypothetical protein